MLVSVFAAIPSADASWFPSLASKASVMTALDHPVVPAVVLVVEDEMLLRMRAVDMVEDAGYTSVEAVDADEAVQILESRSDIALMFTDIQMPGSMDGLELAHAVHERWPPIKIILVSGQLKPATVDIPADSRFYGKPLEAKEMIAEIKIMIGHG
jgi:CheY-like chemotaxis protein